MLSVADIKLQSWHIHKFMLIKVKFNPSSIFFVGWLMLSHCWHPSSIFCKIKVFYFIKIMSPWCIALWEPARKSGKKWKDSKLKFHRQYFNQGILKGEASLYGRPPVWQVWNQLYDNWGFLFLFEKQANPKDKQEVNGAVILPPQVFAVSMFMSQDSK